jgi:hypothetical protein
MERNVEATKMPLPVSEGEKGDVFLRGVKETFTGMIWRSIVFIRQNCFISQKMER